MTDQKCTMCKGDLPWHESFLQLGLVWRTMRGTRKVAGKAAIRVCLNCLRFWWPSLYRVICEGGRPDDS